MTAQILTFRPKKKPGRLQAMRWLSVNSIEFPKSANQIVWDNLFFGWRFVHGADGIIYFADCIHKGITKDDMKQFMSKRYK